MCNTAVPYVGLHRHTTYSFLDGFGTTEQIAHRLKEIGQDCCAITDHGTVFGHVDFFHTMRKQGVKPILGTEFYHCEDLRLRGREKSAKDEQANESGKINHLTVLAANQVGYRNMLALSKLSFEEGYYYKPRVDWDAVVRHQEGLVVMSGCLGGHLPQLIMNGKADLAYKWADWLNGNIERFYIELVPCPGLPGSVVTCPVLYRIARELDIPWVITDDAHFPDPKDHPAQDLLFSISQRKRVDDPERMYKIPAYHYHCTGEEAVERLMLVAPSIPRAQAEAAAVRTVGIAAGCQVEIPQCNGPVYAVPFGQTADDLLVQWVREGKAYRRELDLLPAEDSPEWATYVEREAHELAIIRHHGFQNYFLLVADVVRWARSENIWAIARGSAGGSLLCYYLGISQFDPIEFDCCVERFIDFSRTDMPDIDIDFDSRYRDRAFEYLVEKYGAEHCAQIAALSTFGAPQAIADACKMLDVPEEVARTIKKLLPEVEDGDAGLKAKGKLKRLFATHPTAQAVLAQYPRLAIAAELEGQIRQHTIHAAGFVVDSRVLHEVVGIINRPGHAKVVACDKDLAAEQGLLKIDALSVELMAAMSEVLETIGESHDWLYRLPKSDPETLRKLAAGKNQGVFQFKGHSAGKLLRQLRPTDIHDLVALAALARPGPLQSGGAQEYMDRKHGRALVPNYHPVIMAIVEKTYGVIIYQEQVMRIMKEVGAMEWPVVHKIRKLVSKSGGADAMAGYYPSYREGGRAQGIPDEQLDHLWGQCLKAGNYLFNKAHGVAYAVMAYWSAYLKCYHHGTFACKVANHEKKEGAQRHLLREFREEGGRIGLLDPNLSEIDFSSPEPDLILGGFRHIRGCGAKAGEKLIQAKPFRDWNDFFLKCPGQVRDSLLAAGIDKGKLDLDVVLAIAPWYVEVEFSEKEREAFAQLRCETVQTLMERAPMRQGRPTARLLGRATDIERIAAKSGDGPRERLMLTVTDETGSIDIWFSARKWAEIQRAREKSPLAGPTEGLGNTVFVTATVSDDGERFFGEDMILIRQSRGNVSEELRKALKKQQTENREKAPKLFDHPKPKDAAGPKAKKTRPVRSAPNGCPLTLAGLEEQLAGMELK